MTFYDKYYKRRITRTSHNVYYVKYEESYVISTIRPILSLPPILTIHQFEYCVWPTPFAARFPASHFSNSDRPF